MKHTETELLEYCHKNKRSIKNFLNETRLSLNSNTFVTDATAYIESRQRGKLTHICYGGEDYPIANLMLLMSTLSRFLMAVLLIDYVSLQEINGTQPHLTTYLKQEGFLANVLGVIALTLVFKVLSLLFLYLYPYILGYKLRHLLLNSWKVTLPILLLGCIFLEIQAPQFLFYVVLIPLNSIIPLMELEYLTDLKRIGEKLHKANITSTYADVYMLELMQIADIAERQNYGEGL